MGASGMVEMRARSGRDMLRLLFVALPLLAAGAHAADVASWGTAAAIGARLRDGNDGQVDGAPAGGGPAAAPRDSMRGHDAEARPRHGWSTRGPRVGTFRPLGDSYVEVPRLTTIAYVWRYQTPSFNIETVPALGYAWGGDLHQDRARAREWTLLDLYVTWTPAHGDIAPYAGGGIGLHAVRLERDAEVVPAGESRQASATAMSLSLGAGLTLFRTYDFQVSFDVRYQYFLDDFDTLGGRGARGLGLGFGLQHR